MFGTIAAESQRLINETYSTFVQGFMPSLSRPDVDALENLSAAIVVDQERMGANARSTLGTATDVNAMLRIVFSRLGQPYVGPSFHFGFNAPEGMCPACEGLGRVTDIDIDELVDRNKSLNEGAIRVPGYTPDGWYVRTFTESGFVDGDTKIARPHRTAAGRTSSTTSRSRSRSPDSTSPTRGWFRRSRRAS